MPEFAAWPARRARGGASLERSRRSCARFARGRPDNDRLANFAGPMEQNLRHVEERLGVDVRRRGASAAGARPAGAAGERAEAVLRRMFELSASEALTPDRVHLCVQEFGFPQPTRAATGRARAWARGDGRRAHAARRRSAGAARTSASTCEQIRTQRPHVRHRARRHRQDLSRGRAAPSRRCRPVACGASCSCGRRWRRASGSASCPATWRRRSIRTCGRCTTRSTRCWASTRVARLIERQVIEVAPLAFMRGRSLNDSFIILDEAQNTTRRADEDVPHAASASARRRS